MTQAEIERESKLLNDFIFAQNVEGATKEFFDNKAICKSDQMRIMQASINLLKAAAK